MAAFSSRFFFIPTPTLGIEHPLVASTAISKIVVSGFNLLQSVLCCVHTFLSDKITLLVLEPPYSASHYSKLVVMVRNRGSVCLFS